MSNVPIAEHALLSDLHSAALVTRDGSVDWLCFPRYDGPSVFGRLLDDEAGHWRFAPTSPYNVSRRYLDATMVLETTFITATGTLVLTDAMAFGSTGGGHEIGRGVPHMLVRRLHCMAGSVEVGIEYAPRPEYGLLRPILSDVDGGVTARGGAEWLVLSSPMPVTIDRSTARGVSTLSAGDVQYFAMQRSTLEVTPARIWDQQELAT